jgi:hypothetical protein
MGVFIEQRAENGGCELRKIALSASSRNDLGLVRRPEKAR